MPENQSKTKSKPSIKVVIDTNVLVSSLLNSKGNPAKIIKLVGTLKVQLYYNAEIIKEYNRVLHYPKLKITQHQIDSILNLITEHGIAIEAKKSTFEMTDEDDRIFYDIAKQSGSLLVTGNLKHYPKEAFILAPTEFLAKYA